MVSKKRKALLAKGAQQGWLMDVSELQIGAPIGRGSFGQTFEANWRGTRVGSSVYRKCHKVWPSHVTGGQTAEDVTLRGGKSAEFFLKCLRQSRLTDG